MKRHLYTLILLPITSYCMQPQVREVAMQEPPSIAEATKLEPKRFNNYKLNNPEGAFLPSLRTVFEKDKNPVAYLENLQILASGLLLQHLIMEVVQEMSDLNQHMMLLQETETPLIKKITKQKTDFTHLAPDNEFQLNEVISNFDTVKTLQPTTEQIKQIFMWILDSSKGEWINTLGKYLKIRYEIDLHNEELYTTLLQKLYRILPIAMQFTYANAPKNHFLRDNLTYLISVIFNNEFFKYVYLGNSSKAQLEKASKELMDHFQKLSKLYRAHQQSYIQMYTLVRKELYDTFAALVKTGEKDITKYLLPLPEQARKGGKIPDKFPNTLATLPEITHVPIPSLPAFNEQWLSAQKEWEAAQTQAQTAVKKKYVKRRKKSVPIIFESASTQEIGESAETAPVKIRTGTDNSYIAEGGENDLQVIIEDPKNDATITVFKTKTSPENTTRLKNLPPKDYTSNVKQWFDNPEKARVEQGYTDPKNPKYRAGEPAWKPIVLHAFSRLIDDYLYQYGTVGQIESRLEKGKKDILVTIPGKLEYPNGDEETGVFAYIIDSKNGKWYHRMFTPHESKKLLADLFEKGYFAPEMTGYYDVFFPALPKNK